MLLAVLTISMSAIAFTACSGDDDDNDAGGNNGDSSSKKLGLVDKYTIVSTDEEKAPITCQIEYDDQNRIVKMPRFSFKYGANEVLIHDGGEYKSDITLKFDENGIPYEYGNTRYEYDDQGRLIKTEFKNSSIRPRTYYWDSDNIGIAVYTQYQSKGNIEILFFHDFGYIYPMLFARYGHGKPFFNLLPEKIINTEYEYEYEEFDKDGYVTKMKRKHYGYEDTYNITWK